MTANKYRTPESSLDDKNIDSTKDKTFCRCVSMNNTETESTLDDSSRHNESISFVDSSMDTKESSRNLLIERMEQNKSILSRKRPRQISNFDSCRNPGTSPPSGDFSSSNYPSQSVKHQPSHFRSSHKATCDTRQNLKIEKVPKLSHGLYDPNIAYVPFIPTPPSPVRSVVSCDLDVTDSVTLMGTGTTCSDADHEELDVQFQVLPTTPVKSAKSERTVQAEFDAGVRDEQSITCAISHLPPTLQLHLRSLRIEASLAPMKPLVQRLLTHQIHNRKGIFNVAVDPIKLGLKDYFAVVKEPMDLGTIKNKLYTNIYHSHVEVAKDIRLVFRNACLYNPPSHPVHEAAKHLLDYFEDAYAHILSKSAPINFEGTEWSMGKKKKLGRSDGHSAHAPQPRHICSACLGRTCALCNSGCLSLEPSLLICSGTVCSGTKIRRNMNYYCTPDGTRTWCQKCYPTLPTVIPNDEGDAMTQHELLHKRDLLKRRNDEDAVERWVDCTKCKRGVHEMCAFVDEFSHDRDNFLCPICANTPLPPVGCPNAIRTSVKKSFVYSFLTGSELPEMIEDITHGTWFDARSLPQCNISDFLQSKVRERMVALDCPKGAEETVTVRVISDCDKEFHVPDVVQHHFRMQELVHKDHGIKIFSKPPEVVQYRSKAIALFQRIDGMDVCIFCMYAQEYDGEDINTGNSFGQKKRVYLAYIDSVDHFRPRSLRSNIYHELLAAYFATAKARGFVNVHIWSCPPSRGNSFVFWAHPHSQRTPTREHLLTWYHNVLSHAVAYGIITNVMSLYESSFQHFDKAIKKDNSTTGEDSTMVCPPLLDGDFWIEEANRVYVTSATRWVKSKKTNGDKLPIVDEDGNFLPCQTFDSNSSKCPVIQLAILLESCVMKHANAAPFLRPVNAAALRLNDYHEIIKKPMDLGTILTKCLMGEYEEFHEVVSDIELTFSNAMNYNPEGHPIHITASNFVGFVRKQLEILTGYWKDCGVYLADSNNAVGTIDSFRHLSMRLSTSISNKIEDAATCPKSCNRKAEIDSNDNLQLLYDGPDGIAKLMVGNDMWLLDKRHAYKDTCKKKKKTSLKKEVTFENFNSDGIKRESWLSDEVLAEVRNQRAVSFVCSLSTKERRSDIQDEKEKIFARYIEGFDLESCSSARNLTSSERTVKPSVTETRHGLLEFSQFRHLQFDSVRRAKYSTAIILYYLHNLDSKGILPTCSTCNSEIENVRWHKTNKSFDERRRNCQSAAIRMTSVNMDREELCESCYKKMDNQDDFVPVRVSFHRTELKQ